MTLKREDLPAGVLAVIERGAVIPAHPLALDRGRNFDARRQRALSRYYMDAGVGGLAVGVHTTQFAIREVGLYKPVLETAAAEARTWTDRPLALVAGLVGPTQQALREADMAVGLGYHAGLLSLGAFAGACEDEIIDHCKAVAAVIPLFGFYLQPAVGGIALPTSFWRRFAAIDNVLAIKAAPFNRYRTLDVVRGIVEAGAEDRIALYTGNDDHILLDLLASFVVPRGDERVRVRMKGGLLGQWCVWTKAAVDLLARVHEAIEQDHADTALLSLDSIITSCNAAVFDAANDYRGVIAGCHEILRRQGFFDGIWCLDPEEGLSPGQAAEIARVEKAFPEVTDNKFVADNLDRWLT